MLEPSVRLPTRRDRVAEVFSRVVISALLGVVAYVISAELYLDTRDRVELGEFFDAYLGVGPVAGLIVFVLTMIGTGRLWRAVPDRQLPEVWLRRKP